MKRAAVMPRRTVLAFAGMAAFIAVAGLADPGLALAVAPAFLFVALFTFGIHPGEALIERLRTRCAQRCLRARSEARPRLALVVRPVGRLLASALAMRPPPSPLAVSS